MTSTWNKVSLLLAFAVLAPMAASTNADSSAEEYVAAEALGVVRDVGLQMVSIDFDVPRYGPLCVSVDEGTTVKLAWEEFHNLYRLLDEASFQSCDFSGAIAVEPNGTPRPNGITFAEATAEEGNMIVNAVSYFSCSKICSSNGHKVKVCRGGKLGEANECFDTAGCSPERTLDVRSELDTVPEVELGDSENEDDDEKYLAVGTVCRPKNGDGYSLTTGVDTPESCRNKCEEDDRCGAWEFENYSMDDRECELHETDVISFEDTRATGDCQTTSEEDYRCCWIAREIVEAQTTTGTTLVVNEVDTSGGSRGGPTTILALSVAAILAILVSGGV
jgi:hypothetical protein